MTVMRVGCYQQESDTIETLLACQGQLLDLIVAGVPLPHVLRRLCTALDVQVGNVISLVSLMDDEEHFTHRLAGIATQFGLYGFSSSAILSENHDLLGTLEMYCCFPRSPSRVETSLIGRATHVAALAIQYHIDDNDSETNSFQWSSSMHRDVHGGRLFRN